MTVSLEAPVAPAPRRSDDTPAFVALIEAQPAPSDATCEQVLYLDMDKVAVALAASDLATLPADVLEAMGDDSEITEVETLTPERPELARKLAAWIAQGMERLGGEYGLWQTDYALRHMEDQGFHTWEKAPAWGGYDRARMMNMLSWAFHFWAGSEEPAMDLVWLWAPADPENPGLGMAHHMRRLSDMRWIESLRPDLRLEPYRTGYRWVPAY